MVFFKHVITYVSWGGSPDHPKGLGDSGALTWLEFNDSLNFGPCFGAKADLGAHAPLACGRPCLIAPPTLKEVSTTQYNVQK